MLYTQNAAWRRTGRSSPASAADAGQQLVGVLDQVETLGLLLVLRLDEDAERLGREREEGLVVELGRLLVLALEQGLDALADLRREFP